MPEIARFYGIIIKMYYKEHNPPHIHVDYSGREGLIRIEDATMTDGNLPPKALQLVKEWVKIYKEELLAMWKEQKVRKLPPLE